MIIKCNLKEILDRLGMEQKDLSKRTGIREATISDMCRDKNKMFSRQVLEKIIKVLNIKDINELISIEFEEK